MINYPHDVISDCCHVEPCGTVNRRDNTFIMSSVFMNQYQTEHVLTGPIGPHFQLPLTPTGHDEVRQ